MSGTEPEGSPTPDSHLLRQIPIGSRVVVRYRLAEPDELGHTLTDALGELVSADAIELAVATRHGLVRVPAGAVVKVKTVPPAPARRRPRASG